MDALNEVDVYEAIGLSIEVRRLRSLSISSLFSLPSFESLEVKISSWEFSLD